MKIFTLGPYTIKEVQAPENFYNAGEEKTVTLSYAGQNVRRYSARVPLSMTGRKRKFPC